MLSVPLLSRVRLLATPQTAARQASLSIITNPRSLLILRSIESVTPSNHLIPFSCLQGRGSGGFYWRKGVGDGTGRQGGVRPTSQAARQRLQSRCPQGSIFTSLLLSAQILQSSNVESMAQYSCSCSCQVRRDRQKQGCCQPQAGKSGHWE